LLRDLVAQFGFRGHFVVIRSRSYPGHPKYQFCPEQLIRQPALGLQDTSMAMASRARDRATQKPGIFRGYAQLERMTAAWVLTNGPVDHPSFFRLARFMFCGRSLHFKHLPPSSLGEKLQRTSYPLRLD
jgi:hypothetical protein